MEINKELNKEILDLSLKLKDELDIKMKEYENAFNYGPKKFFMEVAFCILTPQSKALAAWDIILELDKNGLLYTGTAEQMLPYIKTVRFNSTKSKRLVMLRELMTVDGEINPKKAIFKGDDIIATRKWIIDNVNGMGYKEASHVLRNLGFGKQIAILDRHILRILKELNVIDEVPKTLSYKKYLEIEQKMIEYSKISGIPMDRLDLVLWHRQVGYMFK